MYLEVDLFKGILIDGVLFLSTVMAVDTAFAFLVLINSRVAFVPSETYYFLYLNFFCKST